MTINTEDKNSSEILQEIKTLRTEIQMISGYMEALYLMIKDLAEYTDDDIMKVPFYNLDDSDEGDV